MDILNIIPDFASFPFPSGIKRQSGKPSYWKLAWYCHMDRKIYWRKGALYFSFLSHQVIWISTHP